MEGIRLEAALALLLRADLRGPPKREGERLLERGLTFDLAVDVADDPERGKRLSRDLIEAGLNEGAGGWARW
jgi:hypothetical protein